MRRRFPYAALLAVALTMIGCVLMGLAYQPRWIGVLIGLAAGLPAAAMLYDAAKKRSSKDPE